MPVAAPAAVTGEVLGSPCAVSCFRLSLLNSTEFVDHAQDSPVQRPVNVGPWAAVLSRK